MNFSQMNYLIAIVEAGCNLSVAAKKIHISQSALSQFVKNFEREEDLVLFIRKNGRLDELSASGQIYYEYAKKIIIIHKEMEEMVRKEADRQRGTIRIGLPSLVLTVLFSNFFSQFTVENPEIKIDIIEEGSHELKRMLYEKELDYAVLVEPTGLDPELYEEHVIQIDEYSAFMKPDHPLSGNLKIDWKNLDSYQLATFMESFITNRLISKKLKQINSNASINLTSASWDFLVETTHHSEIIAILPSPIKRYLKTTDVVMKSFHDPIPFNVLLCRPIKDNYSPIETYLNEEMLSYFYQPIN